VSTDPNDAAVALQQHSDLVESIDAAAVVVEAIEDILQPTSNEYDYNVGSTVDVDGTIITEELQQKQKDVRMCKSDMISFKFETSLLRDESKLTVIFKSIPEYADTTSDLTAEYQGDSVTGIFTPDYHHVCGQPINDSNHNTQMRGVVYYVREISISDDFNKNSKQEKRNGILYQVDNTGKDIGFWNGDNFTRTDGKDKLIEQYNKNIKDLGFTFLSRKVLTPAEYEIEKSKMF
jgi:hypothetical protein